LVSIIIILLHEVCQVHTETDGNRTREQKKIKNKKIFKKIPLSSPKITNYTVINFNDGKNKLHFNAMMMMYVLWLTNTFSGIFIVQHSADRFVAPLAHIILIPSQQVFTLTP